MAQGEISHSQPGGGRSGKLGCVLTGKSRLLYIRTVFKKNIPEKKSPPVQGGLLVVTSKESGSLLSLQGQYRRRHGHCL